MRVAWVLVAILGCSTKQEGGAAPTKSGVDQPAATDKVTFEDRTYTDGPLTYHVRVPRGWKQSFNVFGPADATDGSMMLVSYKCGDEACAAFDEDRAFKAVFDGKNHTYKILGDTRDKYMRVIRAEENIDNGTDAVVFVAKWLDGNGHYTWCEAHLTSRWAAARDEFVQACQAMTTESH